MTLYTKTDHDEIYCSKALVQGNKHFVNKEGLLISNCVVDPSKNSFAIRVMNPNSDDRKIFKKTFLGVGEPVLDEVEYGSEEHHSQEQMQPTPDMSDKSKKAYFEGKISSESAEADVRNRRSVYVQRTKVKSDGDPSSNLPEHVKAL